MKQMKTKLIALAILASIFTACSTDDEPTITQPPVIEQPPVDMCNCLIKRYKVNTMLNGTPTDTIYLYSGYRNTDAGIYQEACGTNRWQMDYQTYIDGNDFYYETENYIAQ